MASEEAITRGGADRLSAGSEFGGFRIERTLGHGGMGIVYLATELRLERQVALKVIRAELAGDEGFRARFRSESRTAASVEHPRVVTVFGAGERDGLLYVSMRYVPGRDLGRLVEADGPLSPEEAARLIAQVADGLDAVHAAGLVHRDVKPHNVIVGRGRRRLPGRLRAREGDGRDYRPDRDRPGDRDGRLHGAGADRGAAGGRPHRRLRARRRPLPRDHRQGPLRGAGELGQDVGARQRAAALRRPTGRRPRPRDPPGDGEGSRRPLPVRRGPGARGGRCNPR